MSRPNTLIYKTLNWPAYNQALKRRGKWRLDIMKTLETIAAQEFDEKFDNGEDISA